MKAPKVTQGKFETLLAQFDGTIDSVPPEVQGLIMDKYSDESSLEELGGKYNIPAEITRVVLEQPDLMQKALERQKGHMALRFVNQVLPAVITKAAAGGSGSIMAAKLVADVIGAVEGRSVGRPKQPKEGTESGPGLEAKLIALEAQANQQLAGAEEPPVKPRKGRSKSPPKRKKSKLPK